MIVGFIYTGTFYAMHYSKCHGTKSALSFSVTAYVLLSCMVARDVHVLHDPALQKHVSTCTLQKIHGYFNQ